VVVSLDDEVDLVVTVLRAQVVHLGLRGLGVDAQAQRDKGLEEPAQERPVPADDRAGLLA